MIESQMPNLGSYWTFLVLTAFQIEDNKHWPALYGLPSPLTANTREPWPANGDKAPLDTYTGSKKAATETRLETLEQGTQWYIEPAIHY